jgi:hypothetical protein
MGDRPRLSGSLDLGDLDLRPILESGPPSAQVGGLVHAGGRGLRLAGEPLDLPLPLPLDIDLEVRLGSLVTDQIQLGRAVVRLAADQQRTDVRILELALYDGQMTGGVALANGAAIGLEADGDITGVQLSSRCSRPWPGSTASPAPAISASP